MKTIVVFISFLLIAVVSAAHLPRGCVKHGPFTIHCECKGHTEEVDLGSVNDVTATKLVIKSCNKALIPFDLGEKLQVHLTHIIVKDVKTLEFSADIHQPHIQKLELMNIDNIEQFDDTFKALTQVGEFVMENTVLEKFSINLYETEVGKFILKNVTIEDLSGLEFTHTKNGTLLEIINCHITVTGGNLTFETFDKIKIYQTTFVFDKQELWVKISGKHIHLRNNIFHNAVIEVTGEEISVTDTCADGRSSMRLNAGDSKHNIISYGNRLPTGIVHSPKPTGSNNTECKGGNCNCLKTCRGSQCTVNNANNINKQTYTLTFLYSTIITLAAVSSRM